MNEPENQEDDQEDKVQEVADPPSKGLRNRKKADKTENNKVVNV